MRAFVVGLAFVAALPSGVACGGPVERPRSPPDPTPPGSAVAWAASSVRGTEPRVVSSASSAPSASSPAGPNATPMAPAAATAATAILTGLASAEAPGAHADGAPFAAQFLEGQSLEQVVAIAQDRCYTIVAVGMGIEELDVGLVAAPAPSAPTRALAQGVGAGATTVLGGKAQGCYKLPMALGGPAKVIVRASRGSGIAAAQVFSK